MSFLNAKDLSLDVHQRLIFDRRHWVSIANGILQSPHNNCGRGIAPYVYRSAELIQDPVDGQNQTDAVQGKACGRQYDTHIDKTGAGYYRCTDFSP